MKLEDRVIFLEGEAQEARKCILAMSKAMISMAERVTDIEQFLHVITQIKPKRKKNEKSKNQKSYNKKNDQKGHKENDNR